MEHQTLQEQQLQPTELAALHHLGASSGSYRYRTVYQLATFITFIVTGLALFLPIWLLFSSATDELSFENADAAIFAFVSGSVIALMALALLWVGIRGLVAVYQHHGTTIYLYKEGFILAERSKNEIVRWEQVSAFWQSITRPYINGISAKTRYFYRIQTRENRKYTFGDNVSDIAEMGQKLTREITRTLLPGVIAAYESGETVSFGKFRINKQGISERQKTLPWNRVERIEVETGRILLKKRGQYLNWSNVLVAEIPNALVLVELVGYILEQGNKRGR